MDAVTDSAVTVTVYQHSSSATHAPPTTERQSEDARMAHKRRSDGSHANVYSNINGTLYSMDCGQFIQEIMIRPGIWDINNLNYKNKMAVRILWSEIHRKFPDIPVEDLKKRWKNLKDSYRKELKRLQKKYSSPDIITSSWRYFDSLSFLREQFNLSQVGNNEAETDKYHEASSQSPNSPASSKSENDDEDNPDTPSTSKRNDLDVKAELLKIERKKMKILEEEIARNNQHMDSDNYHFLMSLLPEMNKLGPLQKMRLRTNISQAFLDEVSSNVYENENKNPLEEQNEASMQDPIQLGIEEEVKEEVINMCE